MNRRQAKEHLTGPVPSIRTPFNPDGSVDYPGLRRNIDRLLEENIRTVMLTAGDSHFDCLSEQEQAEVSRVTIDQVAGKMNVIAADCNYSTDRALAFARFVRELGADFIMCLPPDWGKSCTPETLAEHYAAVSHVLPVMIVTNRFLQRGEEFGLKTLELSFQKSEQVVAVKDDMCGTFAWKLAMLANKYNVATIAGGRKYNHLNMLPYGVDGYLSTFINFKPDVTSTYWQAIRDGDMPTAVSIVTDIDIPFFEYIIKEPGGYDAAIHATMELFGIYGRYRRKPYYTCNDEDMAKLKTFLQSLDVLS